MDWERALYTCALHLRVIPTPPFPRSRAYIYIYIFFFHSFIGCSSSDIQYKFVIQHKKKEKKKKQQPKRGRCNGTNVPCEAPPLFACLTLARHPYHLRAWNRLCIYALANLFCKNDDKTTFW